MLKDFSEKKKCSGFTRLDAQKKSCCYSTGMRTDARIEENLSSVNVELTEEEYEQLKKELSKIKIYGNRTDKDIAEGLESVRKAKENLNK